MKTCRLVFAFACATSIWAQFPKLPGKTPPPKTAGTTPYSVEFYENLRNYAEGLYKQKERQDFKVKVDRDYEALLRDHADRALKTNMSPHSEVQFILEDRFRIFSGLYDNLMIQDAVNRIGQEVVPKWSEKLVTFKLIADPVPRAEALATGTVYVTTGLVAAMDNKAQLAYVLAHEAAHVAKEHWRTRVMIENAKEEYAKAKAENQEQINMYGALVGLGVGAIAGGTLGHNAATAIIGGLAGAATGAILSGGFTTPAQLNLSWNEFEEDEADSFALATMLDAKIDVRQVSVLYLAMDKISAKDDRVGMGFWGNRSRMLERMEAANEFLKTVKDTSGLTGTDPEFAHLVAELKRDNGVLAFHNDMLDVARANLAQAVQVREADPVALYYYGKILNATARTEEERAEAQKMFARAIKADSINYAYGAYLHEATALLENGTAADKQQAAGLLEQYLAHYMDARRQERTRGQDMPPHLDTIVDYMHRAGFPDWKPGQTATVIPVSEPAPTSPPPTVTPVSAPAAPAAKPKTPAPKAPAPAAALKN